VTLVLIGVLAVLGVFVAIFFGTVVFQEVCLYMCGVFVHAYIHSYLSVYVYIYIYIYIYMYVYSYMCVCVCVCVCVCMYRRVCVCVCVCVCVYKPYHFYDAGGTKTHGTISKESGGEAAHCPRPPQRRYVHIRNTLGTH
jgi:hypothetical protein